MKLQYTFSQALSCVGSILKTSSNHLSKYLGATGLWCSRGSRDKLNFLKACYLNARTPFGNLEMIRYRDVNGPIMKIIHLLWIMKNKTIGEISVVNHRCSMQEGSPMCFSFKIKLP